MTLKTVYLLDLAPIRQTNKLYTEVVFVIVVVWRDLAYSHGEPMSYDLANDQTYPSTAE